MEKRGVDVNLVSGSTGPRLALVSLDLAGNPIRAILKTGRARVLTTDEVPNVCVTGAHRRNCLGGCIVVRKRVVVRNAHEIVSWFVRQRT